MASRQFEEDALASHSGRDEGRRQVRRGALYVFFCSVAVNAALGIYALVVPGFGDTEGKILATSFCITGALVLSLLCAPAWERRLLGLLPLGGAATGVAGFVLLAVAIWVEPGGDGVPKSIATLLIPAAGLALMCLLALAPLPRRLRGLFPLEFGLIAVGVALALTGIWGEIDNEWYLRLSGVVAVALGALTVTIPVLHRVGRTRGRAGEDGAAVSYCPFCGGGVSGAMAASVACERCDRSFTVVGGRMQESDPSSS